MTSKGIFYSTRPFNGREGEGIMHHIKSIQSKSEVVDALSDGSTDAIANTLYKFNGMSIRSVVGAVTSFYLDKGIHMSNWMDFYNELDVSAFEQYDDLYLMGGVDLWRSGLTRNGKRSGVFPTDRGQINFVSTGLRLANILALLKAHNTFGTRLHELAYDPNEMPMSQFHPDVAPKENYWVYHGYDIPHYNIKRLDSSQYQFKGTPKWFESDKKYDFTFGYTVLQSSDRAKYIDWVNDMASKFPNANLFVKSDCDIEDTSVSRSVYLNKIEESKFTLMLPSYDESCFSIYRFIESLDKKCLPIIHKSCILKDVEQSYNVDLSPLVVDEPMSEATRVELLDYYRCKFLVFEKGFRNE
jgi:hypothetical protein